MYAFSPAKNKAGRDTNKLSFNRILTINPAIISNARPREETIKIGVNRNPIIKPVAPNNSNIIVNNPIFSNPKRLNSFFMFGETK